MKSRYLWVVAAALATLPATAQAQTAGSTVLGVSSSVLADVVKGWSAKRSILGKDVYNDANPQVVVGSVDDIIVTPAKSVSYAIVDASKFLGLSKHDVAIPVDQFIVVDKKLVLPGATKDALRAMSPFQYANQ